MIENVVIVIPALNPDEYILKGYIKDLKNKGFSKIVIVNDGSDSGHAGVFEELKGNSCTIITHEINKGKGAALKTAFKYVLQHYSEEGILGVITADSDGQHAVDDLYNVYLAMKEDKDAFILGCRDFAKTKSIPLKSLTGNVLTTKIFKFLFGEYIPDTQTGLRGIPFRELDSVSKIKGDGFNYEMAMLVDIVHTHKEIVQVPIKTIYIFRNIESHFKPVRDSFRIYSVLLSQFLSYSLSSLISTVIELTLFQVGIYFLKFQFPVTYIFLATAIGRIAALTFNYIFNRHMVFHENSRGSGIKYILLAIGQFVLSSSVVSILSIGMGCMELPIKIITDTVLFLLTYKIQSRFIFNSNADRKREERNQVRTETDWTEYYKKPKSRWSTFTQKFTLEYLINRMREIGVNGNWEICECGGGNSCFAQDLIDEFRIGTYDIIDKCELGVEKARNKLINSKSYCLDLTEKIESDLYGRYDLVYSIGLIEHFDDDNRRKVIENHFALCKRGGLCLNYGTYAYL